MTKLCKACTTEKDLTEFDKRYSAGGNICNPCKKQAKINDKLKVKATKERAKLYYKDNKEKMDLARRRKMLKDLYDITPEQYDEMLKKQNGVCAICEQVEFVTRGTGRPIALAVDHDHATGNVRGILCNACNRHLVGNGDAGSVEKLRDKIKIIEKAIKYIEANITYVSLT